MKYQHIPVFSVFMCITLMTQYNNYTAFSTMTMASHDYGGKITGKLLAIKISRHPRKKRLKPRRELLARLQWQLSTGG